MESAGPLGPMGPRLQNLGDAEVTFKDETDEIIKLPAAKLPELPKVEGNMFFFSSTGNAWWTLIPIVFSKLGVVEKTSKWSLMDLDVAQGGYLYVPGSKLPLFPYNRGWSSTQ